MAAGPTQKRFGLIVAVSLWIYTTAGAQSVVLRTLPDVTSGQSLCPNLSLIFECTGSEVTFLEWQRNGVEIEPNFNIGDSPGERNTGPYTIILEAIDVDETRRVANMTTQLVVNISSLMSGDQVTCATLGVSSSKTLDYTIRGPPPAPMIAVDFSISLGEDNSTFDISWTPSFTGANAITSYIVTPPPARTSEGGQDLTVRCPLSCSPDVPCQCTGLAVGECVTVNISAVNCDSQEGEAMEITVASTCLPSDLGTMDSTSTSRCAGFGGSVTISNGIGCFNTLTVGSVATYTCDEGYASVHGGDLVRTCFINGSWNGSIPECTVISRRSSSQRTVIISVVVVVSVALVLATVLILVIIVILVRQRKCYLRKPKRYVERFDPEPDENYRNKIQKQ